MSAPRKIPLPIALLLLPLALVLGPVAFVLNRIYDEMVGASHRWHMEHDREYYETFMYYFELRRTNLKGVYDVKGLSPTPPDYLPSEWL